MKGKSQGNFSSKDKGKEQDNLNQLAQRQIGGV